MSREDKPGDDEDVPMLAELENVRAERMPSERVVDSVQEALQEVSRLVANEPYLAAYFSARLAGYRGRALMKVARLTRWQYRRCRRQLAAILEHPPRYN